MKDGEVQMADGGRCGGVLIVDDDLDVCEAYAEVLAESGYRVITTHNGREALEYLAEAPEPPCLILLDLMMPIMDGAQLHRELRNVPRLRTVPLVVMTAGRKLEPVEAVKYLQKPVSLDALLSAVARHCPRCAT